MDNMNKPKLASPWISFYREIEAMFKEDEQVHPVYDEENNVVKLYVENQEKAEALEKILPDHRTFGNVTVTVTVIPANKLAEVRDTWFRKAFEGNPAVSYITTITDVFNNPITYVVFKNKVVQYYNDDLGDVHGNRSTLYQDIAKEIFEDHEGIFFCTDV